MLITIRSTSYLPTIPIFSFPLISKFRFFRTCEPVVVSSYDMLTLENLIAPSLGQCLGGASELIFILNKYSVACVPDI